MTSLGGYHNSNELSWTDTLKMMRYDEFLDSIDIEDCRRLTHPTRPSRRLVGCHPVSANSEKEKLS